MLDKQPRSVKEINRSESHRIIVVVVVIVVIVIVVVYPCAHVCRCTARRGRLAVSKANRARNCNWTGMGSMRENGGENYHCSVAFVQSHDVSCRCDSGRAG